MRKFMITMLAILTMGSGVTVAPISASAQVVLRPVERHYGGYRHHRPHRYTNHRRYYNDRRYYNSRRYYNDRYYYRNHRRNRDAAIAAGVAGLAVGAIVGSAASQPRYYRNDRHSYCASRYRSYDPRTGTFMGYDGVRRVCR
jgi:hypothetical protein